MTTQNKSISNKIARAEFALNSGNLANYSPVKSSNSADTKVPKSWGSAMRR
jgi:hypothetical protein